ncbi:leucyl/phenylalanyl-tRNA--protein transferase [Lysobacter sp. TY2-98]|uniref:leucyl/phenylalanyl-tRNA--protein transferase n=1 Tax=Lysobacter sp. TY2-98 TaxID=2290922 RepID=UPI000E20883A|nr:leucyl/phenylalanyl-tRNA--protein transferase [Lysobacter sp. TY2-98]AXK71801.1 leucyl/phenylalanyl-tRNA--protein transferase [Lysobacter sp. TY2-98]
MSALRLPWLDARPDAPFPDPSTALREPDGLLAVGGDLHPLRLLTAYRAGIFPWFSEGEPPLWWSPDPRTVFRTDHVATSRRFRRGLRHCDWIVRADSAFETVIDRCAGIARRGQRGTWITVGMRDAYVQLHRLGHAHSVEAWDGDRLVGGIYGVAIGRMFFGESMFSQRPDGSKVAIAGLAHRLTGWGWPLIDAQVENPHLLTLGAERWARSDFLDAVRELVDLPDREGTWTETFGDLPARELSGLSAG